MDDMFVSPAAEAGPGHWHVMCPTRQANQHQGWGWGGTGSFKLVPKHIKRIQPRKTTTMTAPRRPGEAKE